MERFACRKAATQLHIKDGQGRSVANTDIDVELLKHQFGFACGAFDVLNVVDENLPTAQKEQSQTIMAAWLELFNTGVLPFYLNRFEPVEGEPATEMTLKAAKWLHSQNITLKGHPLCWHTNTVSWLMEKNDEEVLHYQLDRIQRDVGDFQGLVDCWDVINEVVIMPEFVKKENAITRLCQKIGRVELVRLVFEKARKTNPNAFLLLNDFNVTSRYLDLFTACLQAGVEIDGVGIQSHQHQGYWGLEKLHKVVERFEKLKLPIHFTENTLISGELMPPHFDDLNDYQVSSWLSSPQGEDRQARQLLEMVDFLFDRPSVEVFTVWCVVDDRWLHAPAGLLRKDGSRKPAFDALKQRICKDWHTICTLHTDENGIAQLEGYQGEYSIKSKYGVGKTVLAKDIPEQMVVVQ
ncbi:MAG: 1,4-beta-xylanase [Clostridiales bacterium]|nr:1,4-beta-xylanase [Clostridiales bacterium]